MSASQDHQPLTANEQDFQSTRHPISQADEDLPNLEDDYLSDDLANRSSQSPYNPDSSGDEGGYLLQTQQIEHATTPNYDETSQLRSNPLVSDGTPFHDRRSNFVRRNAFMPERNLTASLDYARSKDLSIHLYNVFKMKQAARIKAPTVNGFIETKEPPKGWSAWPMPPDVVPREHETEKWEDEEWRFGPYVKRGRRPGDELKEILTARVLKTAKERLKARDAVDTQEIDYEESEVEPVIIADDNVATKVLTPSIRHAMGKLDSMLMGLHHARSSYSTMRRARPKKAATQKRASPSHGEPTAPKRDMPAIAQGEASEEIPGSDIETSASEDSRHAKISKKEDDEATGDFMESNLSSRGRLGLRDWSDVLSIAGITGVDSMTIDRAASRCTNLLSEGMSFKILYEDSRKDKEIVYLPGGGTSKTSSRLEGEGL